MVAGFGGRLWSLDFPLEVVAGGLKALRTEDGGKVKNPKVGDVAKVFNTQQSAAGLGDGMEDHARNWHR